MIALTFLPTAIAVIQSPQLNSTSPPARLEADSTKGEGTPVTTSNRALFPVVLARRSNSGRASGEGALIGFVTIQAAINFANDGDTIIVTTGDCDRVAPRPQAKPYADITALSSDLMRSTPRFACLTASAVIDGARPCSPETPPTNCTNNPITDPPSGKFNSCPRTPALNTGAMVGSHAANSRRESENRAERLPAGDPVARGPSPSRKPCEPVANQHSAVSVDLRIAIPIERPNALKAVQKPTTRRYAAIRARLVPTPPL